MADRFFIDMSMSQFNKAINAIEKQLNDKIVKVDNEIAAGSEEIMLNAKRKAPIDITGTPIAQGMYVKKNRPLSYSLISKNPYSAYYEFGTGRYAENYVPTLPDDWQKLARSYYVDGSGTIPRHTFFYTSIFEGLPKLINNIKNILKNA